MNLLTNLQNFAQKDLTKVKIFQNVSGGILFDTPCTTRMVHFGPSNCHCKESDVTKLGYARNFGGHFGN